LEGFGLSRLYIREDELQSSFVLEMKEPATVGFSTTASDLNAISGLIILTPCFFCSQCRASLYPVGVGISPEGPSRPWFPRESIFKMEAGFYQVDLHLYNVSAETEEWVDVSIIPTTAM
jgi:hypothetical protein